MVHPEEHKSTLRPDGVTVAGRFCFAQAIQVRPQRVDVSDFGGTVREYQVRIDPSKLVSYGLSSGQVEQQLANNNINAGGSFVEVGKQQMNVRALGLFGSVHDIEQTVLKTQTGTALRVKDIGEVTQGPKIRLGHMARANHMEDGRIIDERESKRRPSGRPIDISYRKDLKTGVSRIVEIPIARTLRLGVVGGDSTLVASKGLHLAGPLRSAQKARVWKPPFVDVLPNLLARKAVGEFRFLFWFFTEPWLVCLQGTDGPGGDSVLRR